MNKTLALMLAALLVAVAALTAYSILDTDREARAGETVTPRPSAPIEASDAAPDGAPADLRSAMPASAELLEHPGLVPTAAELVEGSEAWQRYMVWDADYYAAADPSRIHVERPYTPGETRTPLVALAPTVGFGRPNLTYPEPLAVRASAGVPVTFYAPDWGTFPNGQQSITVRANAEGVATTTFTFWQSASYYRVVTASPVHTGVVVFELQALDPAEWERHRSLLGMKDGEQG